MTNSAKKRENFVRLTEGRTQSALNSIRKIGNLSNRRAYDYTDADVKKIMRALKEAISEVERKFSPSGEQTDKFKL